MCYLSSVSFSCSAIRPRLLELKETWFIHPILEFYRGEDRPRLAHPGEHRSGTLPIAVVGLVGPAPPWVSVSGICLWVDFRATFRRKVPLAPQWADVRLKRPCTHTGTSRASTEGCRPPTMQLLESPSPPPPITDTHQSKSLLSSLLKSGAG